MASYADPLTNPTSPWLWLTLFMIIWRRYTSFSPLQYVSLSHSVKLITFRYKNNKNESKKKIFFFTSYCPFAQFSSTIPARRPPRLVTNAPSEQWAPPALLSPVERRSSSDRSLSTWTTGRAGLSPYSSTPFYKSCPTLKLQNSAFGHSHGDSSLWNFFWPPLTSLLNINFDSNLVHAHSSMTSD